MEKVEQLNNIYILKRIGSKNKILADCNISRSKSRECCICRFSTHYKMRSTNFLLIPGSRLDIYINILIPQRDQNDYCHSFDMMGRCYFR